MIFFIGIYIFVISIGDVFNCTIQYHTYVRLDAWEFMVIAIELRKHTHTVDFEREAVDRMA